MTSETSSTTLALLGVTAGLSLGVAAASMLTRGENNGGRVGSGSDSSTAMKKGSRPAVSGQKEQSNLSALTGTQDQHDEAIRGGFSMSDAMKHNAKIGTMSSSVTPEDVLNSLQRGNTRFWMGNAARPEASAFERRAMIMSQHPSVAILGCADARVPIEIIFDQGLGDIFTIRVAGNCLDTSTTGSLEYAVIHLKVKCLVIMGHEGCGAIQAARMPIGDIEKMSKDLGDLLKGLKEGLDEKRLCQVHDRRACDREAVTTNVKFQVRNLLKNKAVKKRVASGDLIVVGAFYEQSSGIVDFFRTEEMGIEH